MKASLMGVISGFWVLEAERGTYIHLKGDSLMDYGQELESEVGQEGVMCDTKDIFSTR